MLNPAQAERLAPAAPPARSRGRPLPAAWWLLSLAPADMRVLLDLVDGKIVPAAWALAFLPPLALLAVVAWSHLHHASLAVQLKKELRLLGPLALATLPAGGALLQLSSTAARAMGLVLLCGGAFFVARHSFAAEVESGTFVRWVLSPRGTSRHVASKFVALALVLVPLMLAATAVTADPVQRLMLWTIGGLSLLMGPYFGLIDREPRLPPWVLLVPTVTVAGAALLHDALFVPALYGWGLFCAWRTFRVAHRAELGGQPRALPGLRIFGSGKARPWVALARKELRLQSGPAAIARAMVLCWLVFLVVSSLKAVPPDWSPSGGVVLGLLWTLAWGAAVLAGAGAFADERKLGTMVWQEALVPRSSLFWTKVGASFATAVAVSVVLPVGLLAISPGLETLRPHLAGVREAGELFASGLMALALPANFMVAAWAAGLAASTRQRDTPRAFIVAVAILGGAAVLVGAGLTLGAELTRLRLESVADFKHACAGLDPSARSFVPHAAFASNLVALSPFGLFVLSQVVVARRWWDRGLSLRALGVAFGVVFTGALVSWIIALGLSEWVGLWSLCSLGAG